MNNILYEDSETITFNNEEEDGDVIRFYRYESPLSNHVYDDKLDLRTFRSIKETDKGHWICEENKFTIYIEINPTTKRWVSKEARKRYAYPTKEEALNSFQHRKVAQLRILASQMHSARTALKIANKKSERKFTLDNEFDRIEIRLSDDIRKHNFLLTGHEPKSPIFNSNFKDIFLTEEDMNL